MKLESSFRDRDMADVEHHSSSKKQFTTAVTFLTTISEKNRQKQLLVLIKKYIKYNKVLKYWQ